MYLDNFYTRIYNYASKIIMNRVTERKYMNINLGDLIRTADKEKDHDNIIDTFIKELEKGLERMNNRDIKEITIDRFENDIAVCENRETKEIVNIKLEKLPEGAKEGSILTFKEGKFILNQEKEREVSKRIKEKMDNLWNN